MFDSHPPSLTQIKLAHQERIEYERFLILNTYFFRPISFPLTWICIRLKLSTEFISYLSGLAGLVGLVLLPSRQILISITGIGFLMLYNLLDCIDGDIARVTNTKNPYGKFLDSIAGDTLNFGFFIAVGIMAYRNQGLLTFSSVFGWSPTTWLLVAVLTQFLFTLQDHYASVFYSQMGDVWFKAIAANGKATNNTPSIKNKKSPSSLLVSIIRNIDHNIYVFETQYLLLLITFLSQTVDLYLCFSFSYYFIHTILKLILYIRRARYIKSVGVSQWASGRREDL